MQEAWCLGKLFEDACYGAVVNGMLAMRVFAATVMGSDAEIGIVSEESGCLQGHGEPAPTCTDCLGAGAASGSAALA